MCVSASRRNNCHAKINSGTLWEWDRDKWWAYCRLVYSEILSARCSMFSKSTLIFITFVSCRCRTINCHNSHMCIFPMLWSPFSSSWTRDTLWTLRGTYSYRAREIRASFPSIFSSFFFSISFLGSRSNVFDISRMKILKSKTNQLTSHECSYRNHAES